MLMLKGGVGALIVEGENFMSKLQPGKGRGRGNLLSEFWSRKAPLRRQKVRLMHKHRYWIP
jgi:hypothetical protein